MIFFHIKTLFFVILGLQTRIQNPFNYLRWSHSFLQGWKSPFKREPPPPPAPPPPPPLSDANLKSYAPLSESNPNWCMQIVGNTLKRRCYVLYYTKSIESIINITLFTFRLNSAFTTDTFFC